MNDTHAQTQKARELYIPGVYGYVRVAQDLGVTAATVRRWLNPDIAQRDLEKARLRKQQRRGICVDCGAPTSYSGKRGNNGVSERCPSCSSRKSGEDKTFWTKERLIDAIHRWAAEYGEPPAIHDWNPYACRHDYNDEERAQRFESYPRRTWPWFNSVVRAFGTWNNAIEAAGYTPRVGHGGSGNQDRRRSARTPPVKQPAAKPLTLDQVFQQHLLESSSS